MKKKNCWEYKQFGRTRRGAKVAELGMCPAVTFALADGFPGGKNGERESAFITGTHYMETVRGLHLSKKKECNACPFYQNMRGVEREQPGQFEFLQHSL